MREIILDSIVYDMKTLTIVEIMGRNAGWLTAAAALARSEKIVAPHFIYLPEVVFDLEKFISDVDKALDEHRNVVVAVSEGVKLANGKYVFETDAAATAKDAFGHTQLSGTALTLSHVIKQKIGGVKVRAIEFSLLQRSAAHIASLTDVTEARQIGNAGAKAALVGSTGVMMSFYRVSNSPYKIEIHENDVNKIANEEKGIPREWISPEGNDVTAEVLEYMRPLIQGESKVKFVDGVPVYAIR
jgi:6-phosphofructokinase 1